ncbi:MAG: DUF373 family protein [Thermoplasmata archaeon]|nr:DUF373 family protein [Thermoplasmata archaeon]
MRLVVSVDRDDDLGRKAGVQGPVVGRAAVLDAAMRLGIADPEDSDTNALFAAVHLYDEILRSGDECEVAVLTGSPKVGFVSDRKVSEQFDKVLASTKATSAHLVSDGAEDEFLNPILASRVRIDGVLRVFVHQNASIESTYYTITKALKDPKFRAKTLLPPALVLLLIGIAAGAGYVWWGLISLLILLGVYLVLWTFDIDEALVESLRSASSDIRQGSVAFGFGLFAIALVGVGFLSGWKVLPEPTPIGNLLAFLNAAMVFWFVAAEVWESGRALRFYFLRSRLPRAFPIATTSIVGIGFLSYGLVYLVEYLEGLQYPSQLPFIVGAVVLGLGLITGAGILSQYLKGRLQTEASAPSVG